MQGGGRISLPSGTVTFLFTDIAGSTRALQRLGADQYRKVLDDHHQLLREAFRRHRGHELGTEGDSFFVVFPTAVDGAAACLAAQDALAAHTWPEGAEIRVRMGLHSGAAEPTDDGRYVALAVHQAARVAAAGHGGQVLVSKATATLLRDTPLPDQALVDLGEYRLKDFDEPQTIYQLARHGLLPEFPPIKATPVRTTNLPQPRTSFVGRESERLELATLLESERMVTIVGPGGAGKTRLAVEVAREILPRYEDGAWLVELADVADRSLVVHALANTLNLGEQPGIPMVDTIVESLGDKRLLLVMDNCEHVMAAAADLAEALLDRCPNLSVVTTSRAPLGVEGERVWRLPTLDTPASPDLPIDALLRSDSIRLFAERAAAVRSGFVVTTSNAAAVAEICRRLDGIPLAIELAAARVRSLTPAELATRLNQRFRILVGSERHHVPRQQTLAALIAWSYDLLSVPEQRLLNWVSVFAGGFTIDAAETVGEQAGLDRWEIVDLLTALVDKSLVVAEDTGEATRFGLLESIREFAEERLVAEGVADDARSAHLSWFRALAAEARAGLRSKVQAVWLGRCDAERANLRTAIEWACTRPDHAAAGLEMVEALYRFWLVRGPVAEGLDLATMALEASEDRTSLRGWTLLRTASFADRRLDLQTALAYAQEAAALGQETGDVDLEALALNDMGVSLRDAGNLEEGIALGEQALDRARSGRRLTLGTCLLNLGGSHLAAGRHEQAGPMMREARDLLSEEGDLHGLSAATTNLGLLAFRRDDLDEARQFVMEGRELHRLLGDANAEAIDLATLAQIHQAEGDLEAAENSGSEALAMLREVGAPVSVSVMLGILAGVRLARGADPTVLLEEKLAWDRSVGFLAGEATALTTRSAFERESQQLIAAEETAAEAVSRARESGNDAVLASALVAQGEVAISRGHLDAAESPLREALEIFRRLDQPRSVNETLDALKRVTETTSRRGH